MDTNCHNMVCQQTAKLDSTKPIVTQTADLGTFHGTFQQGGSFDTFQQIKKMSIKLQTSASFLFFLDIISILWTLFNPIRPEVLDPGNTPGIQCKGSCLTLKLCMCFRKYILTSHEKKIGLNLKKSVRFSDLKILWIWDFLTTWLTKMAITRSIFEIEGSSFGLFLIFMCLRNHISLHRLYNQFSDYLVFLVPPRRGVG